MTEAEPHRCSELGCRPVADFNVRHEGPATSSAFDATSTIVMTTLQKALSIVVLIVIGGALIYEARKASALTAQVQGLHREQALLSEQNEKLTRQRDEALNDLGTLRDYVGLLRRNTDEVPKLRGEVTRLRSLQKETALQTAGTHAASPVAVWKSNSAMNVGRGRPEDALQTYIWSGMTTNSSELALCVVANQNDPPDERSIQKIIDNPQEQIFKVLLQMNRLSQTPVSANEVLLEFTGRPDSDLEVTRAVTLRKIGDEWRLVLFNQRDEDGKITHVAPWVPLNMQ